MHQLARYASGVACRAPDFLIIGSQKGGTSSLYSYLAQHPNIFRAIRKEVHFFENPQNRAKGPLWYKSFFPTERYLALQAQRLGSAVLTGEASTYMPYSHVPQLLHAISPHAKLIFLLRNPIERAFAHYKHIQRSYPTLEPFSFGDAIRAEPARIQADIDALAVNAWHNNLNYRLFNYRRSGMYAEHLAGWLQYFPRENIYIKDSALFFGNPQGLLQELCVFLNIGQHDFDCGVKHNVGGYSESIAEGDRAYLALSYAADRRELQKLLGASFGANWF